MKSKSVLLIRYGLMGLAVSLIVTGLLKQEHLEVMQKAVKICLECIGIG